MTTSELGLKLQLKSEQSVERGFPFMIKKSIMGVAVGQTTPKLTGHNAAS